METLIKTNNIVYLSWVKNLLDRNDIPYFVSDESMSLMEGSISAIPIRILVDSKNLNLSKNLLMSEEKNLL